jgi:hypothetical protein
MAELSPDTQAVLDAAEPCIAPSECPGLETAIAAALRAAADQVVPDKPAPDVASLKEFERWDAKRFVRLQFLAIVADLLERLAPQPVPVSERLPGAERPTVMEIIELADEIEAAEPGQVDLVRAALARWGRPAPEGPFSLIELATQWNAQADEFNQWDSLGLGEQIGWAQARAIAADRARRSAPEPPPDGEVATIAARLKDLAHAVTEERWCDFSMRVPAQPLRDADLVLTRSADLLSRLSPPQPIPVSERLPGAEDCLDEGWAWFFSPRVGWRQAVLPVSPAFTHWLPAYALPRPQPS